MKYGYEGADDTTLIRNYDMCDDCIIINFIDGASYRVALTPENETRIVEVMLQQAKERKQSNALEKARKNSTLALGNLVASSVLTAGAATAVYTMTDSPVITGAMNVVCGIEAVNIVIRGSKYILNNAEIQELQKYNIYLAIMNQFAACQNNPNVYAGVKNKTDVLTINTLDNFSLADLKQIRSNIRRCEAYSGLHEAPAVQTKKPRH